VIKLSKAINNEGTLIDISDKSVESGLSANLKCPDYNCNSPVIAKKGKKMTHHFAHKPGANCTGLESLLHLLTKEVLIQNEQFKLPSHHMWLNDLVRIFRNEIKEIENHLDFYIPENIYNTYEFNLISCSSFDYKIEVIPEKEIRLSKFHLYLEKMIEGMTPDLRFNIPKTQRNLHVEIFVTHKVDNIKKEKIKDQNLCFLEIDISKHYKKDENITKDRIREIILKRDFKHSWINIPKLDLLITKNKNEILKKIENRILNFKEDYELFCKEILLEETQYIFEDEDYPNELYKKLKKEKSTFSCLLNKEIYNFYVNKYKSSNTFSILKQIHFKDKEISKNEFIDRWGEGIYRKIYGKW